MFIFFMRKSGTYTYNSEKKKTTPKAICKERTLQQNTGCTVNLFCQILDKQVYADLFLFAERGKRNQCRSKAKQNKI